MNRKSAIGDKSFVYITQYKVDNDLFNRQILLSLMYNKI